MSTHVSNNPPSTKITLTDQASVSVDTINVNKEIPKEVFSRYIPKNFVVSYADINQDNYTYQLPHVADKDFLSHFNLFIDDTLIKRSQILDDTLLEYKLNGSLNAIQLSSTLYENIDSQLSKILLVYTPA